MASAFVASPWQAHRQGFLAVGANTAGEASHAPSLQVAPVEAWQEGGHCSLMVAGVLVGGLVARKRQRQRGHCSTGPSTRSCRSVVCRRSLEEEYGLPKKLSATAVALKGLPNDRLRYQQLMAMGAKLPAMAPELKTDENKVPGCLSTVHVHAELQEDGTIVFQGDSDALISKGLVALLVNGLSGCTVDEMSAVNPEFIKASGITASLTPGRNNGFFNMFKLMKSKASALQGSSDLEETLEAAAALAGRRQEEPASRVRGAATSASSSASAIELPPLQLYDTLERKKKPFQPLQAGVVNMYVCGVTVYDLCHLGHARVMVFFDIVARYLEHLGFAVKYVRNVTDIDDKIIKRANENGEDPLQLARRMEAEMQTDAAALGCREPSEQPRVSEHLEEILGMVKTLEEKQYAYPGPQQGDGRDVYFRVRGFSTYGRLSRCSLDGNQAGARVEVGGGKEAPEDFVLWKAAKAGEPSWDSPWGPGRPGWHIECSAMAKKHLGNTLDIHGGGPDLVFPHHENEIAQSEAANGQTYVNTWMHCAAVRSRGDEKMSKSLGNFVTIRDALERYDGESLRFYFLSSQYRQPTLYSEENLAQANERLLKLYTALRGACLSHGDSEAAELPPSVVDARDRFYSAMSNDFDTVTALAALSEVSRELLQVRQQGPEQAPVADAIAAQLRSLGGVVGLLQRDPEEVLRGGAAAGSDFEARVDALVAARFAARQEKNWARADEIRKELSDLGVVLEDTAQGTTWRVGAMAS